MGEPKPVLRQNTQYSRVMNTKYKNKYKRMKRHIKNLVFENAALCDEVSEVQADLWAAREERRYLILRLIDHVDNLEQLEEQQNQEQIQIDNAKAHPSQTVKKPIHIPKKRGPKKRVLNKGEERQFKVRDKVSLDPSGKPKFPINLYDILIHSPGEIIPVNPNFHNNEWIYPVGYVATRIFAHPKDPQRKCVYTCKILNNAGVPQFQLIPDNDLDGVFFGGSANICHQGLLESLQRSLPDVVRLPLNVQGEKFFGLANPTVQSLLQMDTGFKLCAHFQGFKTQQIPDDKDPTISFDVLQSFISMSMSVYRIMPEVRDEPPDELFNLN